MQQSFPWAYPLSDQALSAFWKTAIVVPDTNVLLHLYRYTPPTAAALFRVLDHCKDRLWLPFQIASEFHGNRLQVIMDQVKAYDDALAQLKLLSAFVRPLGEAGRHPSAAAEAVQGAAQSLFGLDASLKAGRAARERLWRDDTILERLTGLLAGRTAAKPTPQVAAARAATASERMGKRVPPGFRDSEKSGSKGLGDALLWLELLERAKQGPTDVLLVTDDRKSDWWQVVAGRTVGLLPDLIEEFASAGGRLIIGYQVDAFVQGAARHLGVYDVSSTELEKSLASAIEEMRHVSAASSRGGDDGYFGVSGDGTPLGTYQVAFHGPDGSYVRSVVDLGGQSPAESLLRALAIGSSLGSRLNDARRMRSGYWSGWLISGAMPGPSGSRGLAAYYHLALIKLLKTIWKDFDLECITFDSTSVIAQYKQYGQNVTAAERIESVLGPYDHPKYAALADGREPGSALF